MLDLLDTIRNSFSYGPHPGGSSCFNLNATEEDMQEVELQENIEEALEQARYLEELLESIDDDDLYDSMVAIENLIKILSRKKI